MRDGGINESVGGASKTSNAQKSNNGAHQGRSPGATKSTKDQSRVSGGKDTNKGSPHHDVSVHFKNDLGGHNTPKDQSRLGVKSPMTDKTKDDNSANDRYGVNKTRGLETFEKTKKAITDRLPNSTEQVANDARHRNQITDTAKPTSTAEQLRNDTIHASRMERIYNVISGPETMPDPASPEATQDTPVKTKAQKARERFAQHYGRQPTAEEISTGKFHPQPISPAAKPEVVSPETAIVHTFAEIVKENIRKDNQAATAIIGGVLGIFEKAAHGDKVTEADTGEIIRGVIGVGRSRVFGPFSEIATNIFDGRHNTKEENIDAGAGLIGGLTGIPLAGSLLKSGIQYAEEHDRNRVSQKNPGTRSTPETRFSKSFDAQDKGAYSGTETGGDNFKRSLAGLPQATNAKATASQCGPGYEFNPVTRQCEPIKNGTDMAAVRYGNNDLLQNANFVTDMFDNIIKDPFNTRKLSPEAEKQITGPLDDLGTVMGYAGLPPLSIGVIIAGLVFIGVGIVVLARQGVKHVNTVNPLTN